MALSAAQKTIADSTARFKVAVCGRRFGKTHLSMREMARAARKPDQKIFYVAPSYRQAKQTVWNKLKKKLIELNWVSKINESDLTITLRNDSTISLRGADNFDGLRGVGLDYIILDEFAFINADAWYEVLRPTLSDTGGGAMFISTPAGVGNWAYDLYLKGQDPTETDWNSWQYTSEDGGRIPVEELEAASRDLDERTYNQEYRASFVTYSGIIYHGFNSERNLMPYTGAKPKQILLMTDFNYNPMAACVGVQCDGYIHIIDEVVIYGSNTQELADEVKNRYPDTRVTVFPDPAGAQNKTSAGGKTDISILENAGFRALYRRKHPAVKDRINAVNSALNPGSGKPKLVIDPKCKRLIEGLVKQTYKEGTQIPDKNNDFNHINDAVGYGVEYLMPVVKYPDDTPQPTHWGVITY